MPHFNSAAIESWDRFYRANLVNSLQGFKPASLIGTINKAGGPNLAIFSNIVHIGANPALIGFINRPKEAAPHTLANIEATGDYTINHIPVSMVAAAHQTSAKYPEEENEFIKTGFNMHFEPGCIAPFVRESVIRYALKLVNIVPIELNNTYFVIGRVTQIYVGDGLLLPDGLIDAHKAGSVASLGIDAYYSTTPLARYEYARPGKETKEIS